MKIIKNNMSNVLQSDKAEINTLSLHGNTFLIETGNEFDYLSIDIFNDYKNENVEGYLSIYLDISFEENIYNDDELEFESKVSPSLTINPINTMVTSISELLGTSFVVESLEEALEREDTMYVFEHESFLNYSLTILELSEDKARVKCSGEYINNEKFALDCWVPLKNRLV